MIRWQEHDERPGLLAEFESEPEIQRAVLWLRERGYAGIEIYSPYPVEGSTGLLGSRRPILTWVVFWFAMGGATLAFILQWFFNALNYPINVGGRPLFSLPAWVPIIFETAILTGGLTAFFTFLIATGLPRLWFPTFEIKGFESFSVDRFWLSIDRRDPLFDPVRTRFDLESLGALRLVLLDPDTAGKEG